MKLLPTIVKYSLVTTTITIVITYQDVVGRIRWYDVSINKFGLWNPITTRVKLTHGCSLKASSDYCVNLKLK